MKNQSWGQSLINYLSLEVHYINNWWHSIHSFFLSTPIIFILFDKSCFVEHISFVYWYSSEVFGRLYFTALEFHIYIWVVQLDCSNYKLIFEHSDESNLLISNDNKSSNCWELYLKFSIIFVMFLNCENCCWW